MSLFKFLNRNKPKIKSKIKKKEFPTEEFVKEEVLKEEFIEEEEEREEVAKKEIKLESFEMEEKGIVAARASVMIYDDENKKWIHSGTSTGVSKVHIYQHLTQNTFRVVGRKLHDHEVSFLVSIHL